jgi:predicted RNase H-like HicB family nuclease
MKNMLPIEVHFRPEGDWWMAVCPSLDIVTQGRTYDEAQDNLQEAIMLFMESCIRRGTLERVLREAGFTAVRVKEVEEMAGKFIPQCSQGQTRCHA